MRIGKRMRKAVSWLLTGALVVAGASGMGTIKAKAHSTLKWTGELYMGVAWGWSGMEYISEGITPSVTDEDSTLELTAIDWNDVGVNLTVADIADFEEPWITVVATETEDGEPHEFAVTDADWSENYAGVNSGLEEDSLIEADITSISGALDRTVSSYNITAQGRTVTAVYVHEEGIEPITGATIEPIDSTVPETQEPVFTSEPEVITGSAIALRGSTLKWTGELEIGDSWGWTGDPSVGITPSVTDEDSTLELTALAWNDVGVGLEVSNIDEFSEPWITVIATEAIDGETHEFAVTDSAWSEVYAGANCREDNENTEEIETPIPAGVVSISGALDKAVTSYNITAQSRTVTAVYVHEKDVDPLTDESPATKEPVITKEPYTSGTTLKWSGELEMGIGWGWRGMDYISEGITPSVTDEDSTLALTALAWNDVGIGLEVANIEEFSEPWITVVATETTDGGAYEFAVTGSDWKEVYAGANCNEDTADTDEVPVEAATTVISGALDRDVTSYNITAQGRTITAVYVHEKDVEPFNEVKRTTAKSFDVSYKLYDPGWHYYTSETVTITGNGTYAISGTVTEDMEDIMMLWLDAGLLGYDNDYNIKVESTVVKVGEYGGVWEADGNWWYRDCVSLESAAGGTAISSDGMKYHCRRLNYRNQYNNYFDEEGNEISEKSPIDGLNGAEIPVMAGEEVTLYITVSGMESDNVAADEVIPEVKDEDRTAADSPTATPAPATPTPFPKEKRITAESFDVTATIVDTSWNFSESDSVTITGDGTYAIEMISVSGMEDINLMWIDAGQLGYDNDLNIKVESSAIKVGSTIYDASEANWWYRDCEDLETAAEGIYISESDGKKAKCRRLTYRNPYILYFDDQTGIMDEDRGTVDTFNGQEISIEEGEVVTIYITVSGMNSVIEEEPTATPSQTAPSTVQIPTPTPAVPSVDQTPTPAQTNTSEITDDGKDDDEDDEYDEEEEEDEDNEKLEEGDTFQKAGFIYTLLNSKSVTVSGYAKNAKSLTIASTVTYKSKKYKIVGIESDAFSDMTSLKKITIGANVKSIGKKAFAGCKKLKTIEIKSKNIVKVGSNALKNISESAKIYTPKKKFGAYKVLFRKKGQKSSVKIVKGSW